MTKINLDQVMEIMEQETGNYGFRGASKKDLELANSGEYLDASLDAWDSGNQTYHEEADKLNGTSAVAINEYMNMEELRNRFDCALNDYATGHGTNVVFFVSGEISEYGDDDHEVVLRDDFENGARIIAEVIVA